jgi:hypothetical protein
MDLGRDLAPVVDAWDPIVPTWISWTSRRRRHSLRSILG